MRQYLTIKTTLHFSLMVLSLLFSSSQLYAVDKPVVCDEEYALCTKAECIPIPGDPKKALCFCKAKRGNSVGYKSCEIKMTKDGYKEIKSRYYPIGSYVQCSNARPWALCMDSPCVVDPNDPKKAYCTCDIVSNKGDYVLPSDTCDKTKCARGLWSSALAKDVTELDSHLLGKEYKDKFPAGQPKKCK